MDRETACENDRQKKEGQLPLLFSLHHILFARLRFLLL